MIIEKEDGDFFDPTHLLEEGMAGGFPVKGERFDRVVSERSAATPDQARHDRGRLRFDGIGGGPPEEVPTNPEGGT